nr:PH13-2-70 [Vibrio phage 1]
MAAKFLLPPKAKTVINDKGHETIESAGEKAETLSDKITQTNNEHCKRASKLSRPCSRRESRTKPSVKPEG